MKKRDTKDSAFDPTDVKAQFEHVLPKIVTEVSDLFEQPAPRLTKRDKQRMSQDFSWGINVSVPHLKTLEEVSGDPARVLESYQNLEQMFRKLLRRGNVRLRRNEDSFD